MRIAFNPSTVAALTSPPNNKDITFDLRGQNIFARGVKFYGTDTNTWRDIKINNVSIDSHTLDLRNGSNTTLTNTNGVVTINSTWRPVVDNLTSDSATSSLSAKQGKVLKSLIDGKSNSGHTHDDRYLKLTGGTMTGNIILSPNVEIIKPLASTSNYDSIVSWSVDGETKQYGREIGLHNTGGNDSTGSIAIIPYKTSTAPWSGTVGLFIAKNTLLLDGKPIALKSDIPSSLKNPYALTISLNGTSQGPYDGSAAKNINITPGSIGAATSGHNHDGRYLALSGGTMTGTINRHSGGATISGRDHAIIRLTYAPGGSSWNPIACVDTETGTWTLGHLSSGSSNTDFSFCFSTNADYNAGNNAGNYVTLRNKVGTIALLSEIPDKNSWNYDDRYVRYYAVTTLDCNNLAVGLTAARVSATNAAHTNHSAYLYISDVGTPFQIQIPDSSLPYIYKRYYGSGGWSGWFKLNAGYADSAGSVAWDNITGKPSSYIPSAHTHTWPSITDKLVVNEFNIVNAGYNDNLWFNYLPINDRSKTASIHTYIMCNGAKGMASVTASGFIKNGSSDSYVLLGGGGHKAESSLNVANADTTDGVHIKWAGALTSTNHLVAWEADGSALRDINPSNVSVGYASSAGYANGIANKGLLDSQEKIDNFITANRFEYAIFKTAESNNVGFASNDGMILSIPWGSTSYGAQIAFDDVLAATVKVRGKSTSWGNWYTLLHSGNYNSYSPTLTGTGASGTWGIDITGNADTVDGYHATSGNNKPWGTIPVITTNGWMDIGKQLEFHFDNTTGSDYSTILRCTGNYSNIVNLPSAAGTLALTSDNVASATKLQTPRTIWGQSFDGTGNVSGSLSGVGHIQFSANNAYDIGSNSVASRNIYTHWLGSKSGLKLELGANDSSFGLGLCIDTNLNVGIGTNTPGEKLDVRGKGSFTLGIFSAAKISTCSNVESVYPNDAAIEIRERNRKTTDIAHNYKNAPRIGFHWGLRYWGNLALYNSEFNFLNDQCSGYFNIVANGFKKSGSSDDYVLLGGGGHKAESSLNVALAQQAVGAALFIGVETLQNAGYLASDYTNRYNTEEFCKALSKYLLTNYSGKSIFGTIDPNVLGFFTANIYNSGFHSNGNPYHLTIHYYPHGGDIINCGTSYGNWYYNSVSKAGHTHSWQSITDKIVAGNEFNIVNAGFKEDLWFNYLPINDRSKSATINAYCFGNGNKGYTAVRASGFIKNDGNGDLLLRADGGVATFYWSGQSGLPTWLWGGNSEHSYYVYNPSNFRVAYAASAGNADTLDSYHESSFLRYRGVTSTNLETTLWDLIGIKSYHNALPDDLTNVYNYGSVISLPGSNSRFEIYASHISSSGNGLYYRSGWDNDKRPWVKFIDSSNIGSQSVNYANSAGNADTVDGKHASDFATAGHNHDGRYLRLDGSDTMTGVLNVKGSQYNDGYDGAINMNNSDIYGLNSIYTSDKSESQAEGIHFWRDETHVDTLRMMDGKLLFTPNRLLGSSGTELTVLHTGNSSVSGHTITINGTSTTWSNTWRPISDDYELGESDTSLSTLGSLTLYNDLLDSIPNPTNYYWANVKISVSSNSGTSPTFNTAYATNWFRAKGNTGFYFLDHAGGWYMSDNDWIRTWGSKALYVNNTIRSTNYQAMYGSTSVSAAKLESANTLVYGTDTSSNSINTYLRGTNVTLLVKKGTSPNYNALLLTSDYIYCNNYCDMKLGAIVGGGNFTVNNTAYLALKAGAKVGIGTGSPLSILDVQSNELAPLRVSGTIQLAINQNIYFYQPICVAIGRIINSQTDYITYCNTNVTYDTSYIFGSYLRIIFNDIPVSSDLIDNYILSITDFRGDLGDSAIMESDDLQKLQLIISLINSKYIDMSFIIYKYEGGLTKYLSPIPS